ncbi:MAG: HAD family phosphatase [Bacteroidia bacterium]|nr:HAD family phosphatase [Bacteroidia bacterium]
MTSIKTVLFDLGNVLIDWNPRYVFHDMFGSQEDLDFFLTHVCSSDWNEEQDAGRPIAEATEKQVALYPEWEAAILAFYGQWTKMLGGPIIRTVDILEELKAQGQVQLLALTNWSAELFPIARKRYSFLQHFEGIIVSGEEGMRKPNPNIYQIAETRYGVQPASTVFIDDSLRNINAAKALGFHVIHFQNPTQLRSALAELGI